MLPMARSKTNVWMSTARSAATSRACLVSARRCSSICSFVPFTSLIEGA